MLQLPSGQWTNTLEEAYEHLLHVHFPGCQAVRDTDTNPTDKLAVPSAYRWVPSTNWSTAEEVVTHEKLKWAIDSMAPYKSLGVDGIYPVLLQRGFKYLSTPLVHIFRASIALGYIPVPSTWRSSRVTFIPKPGKLNYVVATAFRPISLTSFLLKGLEKLVDNYLRSGPLSAVPMHPRKHAFQAGKSTESALHQMVGRIEWALQANEYTLGVFFDIEAAFDNTSCQSVK